MMDAILAAPGVISSTTSRAWSRVRGRTMGSGPSLLDNGAAAALMARIRSDAQQAGPLTSLTDQERTVLDPPGRSGNECS